MIAIPSFNNASWRKSSRSAGQTNCVEVATANGLIGVRDSKKPNSHILVVAPSEWTNFLTVIQFSAKSH
jgi:hypothetical protein